MVAPLRRLSVLFVILLVGLSWLAVPTLAAPPALLPRLAPTPTATPPRLPSTCGDTTHSDPCCAFGYVFVNGTAVTGAVVTITNQAGVSYTDTTESLPHNLDPHYRVDLREVLTVTPGQRVTISVEYEGVYSATSSYIALEGTNQKDFSFALPTQLISALPNGAAGNGSSSVGYQALSGDGNVVAFTSRATNLAPGGLDAIQDLFVHDRTTGRTTLVSPGQGGGANADAHHAALSSDGRYVAFWSGATNLLSTPDTNLYDVYVRDRQLAQTRRVSIASNGTPGDGVSWLPSISADGQRIAFNSGATNLVPNDTNNAWDIFVHDTTTSITTRVSVSSAGAQANGGHWLVVPRISDNGRYVVFASPASNLVTGDTNGLIDLFVRDLNANTTTLVSVGEDGFPAGAWGEFDISADGRYIVFASDARLVPEDTNNAKDIFVRDMVANTTTRVSVNSFGGQTSGTWGTPAISADGRMVAFLTNDATIVLGHPAQHRSAIVYDRERKLPRRVSVAPNGTPANQDVLAVDLSADGRTVVFGSQAGNLVEGDSNEAADVFVHDWRETWLMLFYLAADNDLHPYLVNKYQELAATVRSNVTIGLVLDGSGPNDLVSYLIQPNNSYTLGSTFFTQHEMGGISENIGDARLLEFLLTHSLRFHPADHVYLNITGRGHALEGLVRDMNGPHPVIPPRTFHKALAAAVEASDRRIDVLHLDTHHMASLEMAYDAKEYADYLVASQNLSGPIFPFAAYAQIAATRPSPRQLAAQIVERYGEAADLQPYTISAIDLAQVSSVRDGVHAAFDPAAFADPLATAIFQALRDQAQKFDTRDYYLLDERDEFVDLYDFLRPISAHPLIQPGLAAIDRAVVAERHQSGSITVLDHTYTIDLEGSHGLSIYLPPEPHGFGYEAYLAGELYTFPEGEWDEVLAAFFTHSGFPPTPFTAYPSLPGTQVASGGGR